MQNKHLSDKKYERLYYFFTDGVAKRRVVALKNKQARNWRAKIVALSIAKWKFLHEMLWRSDDEEFPDNMDEVGNSINTCACCVAFFMGDYPYNRPCTQCPVAFASSDSHCNGTPFEDFTDLCVEAAYDDDGPNAYDADKDYIDVRNDFTRVIDREIDFLKRVYGKEKNS